MAAVALPLIEGIAAAAPTVINLITSLVHKTAPVAEATYGPKSGPVKRADVLTAVMGALDRAATSGSIPKALPPDPVIALIVDSVLASMGISGQLTTPSAATPAPAGDQTIALKPGQSLTITA